MTIQMGTTNSYKLETLQGIHDFTSDTINIALYANPDANLTIDTTEYTSLGEISDVEYTAGGRPLSISEGPVIECNSAIIRFDDQTFGCLRSEIDGALIYNASKANRSIMVLSFPVTQRPDGREFQIQFPITAPPLIVHV